jgi:decaprenyl-phosphate phosphoribosyltransferase
VLRTKQWLKNLLVLGAPLAAGRLLDPDVLLASLVAVGIFCLASSACYLFNDAVDVAEDRLHPQKRFRPVARGEIRVSTAFALGTGVAIAATTLAFWWSAPLGLTIVAYLAAQLAYGAGLKHQPALDLAVVCSGFVLRAIAGGTATGIPLSPWFMLVAAFGSLFVVAGKRYSEMHRLGPDSGTRRSLQHYSESYLRFIWTMAAGITVTVYLLWALTGDNQPSAGPDWAALSVAPFVLGLVRYASDIDRGVAEAPENIAVSDRLLQLIGLVWIVLLVLHVSV